MENLSVLDWTGVFNNASGIRSMNTPVVKVVTINGVRINFAENVFVDVGEEKELRVKRLKRFFNRKNVVDGVRFAVKAASVTLMVTVLANNLAVGVASMASRYVIHAFYNDNSELGAVPVFAPLMVDNVGWQGFLDKILEIVGFLMDGVIIFAGISWMFGNRTKAIELLIGGGIGYTIVRHHEDIKNFFTLL